MITADQLRQFESAGVIAAARALHRHTTTINRIAAKIGFEFKTCTERERYRRERHRKSLVGQVRKLARQRMTQREMCEALGITRWVLRRIAAENQIDINSRSAH